MKILYLRGLDGHLSEDKRMVMERYGDVIGPTIDYRSSADTIQSLIEFYEQERVDVVIGNNMGGLAAYYVSLAYNTPCLIFNPALPYTSIPQHVPGIKGQRNKLLQVVLGRQDETIRYIHTLSFLEKHISAAENCSVHIHNTLPHRIGIDVFKLEVDSFFSVESSVLATT